MGQTGKVVLYSTEEPSDPPRLLADLLRLTGATHIGSVCAWHGADKSWAMFQRNLKRLRSGRRVRTLEEMDYERLAMDGSLDEATRHVRPKGCLSIRFADPTIAVDVGLAAERDIPPEVRGEFWFRDLIIWFGWHDLFESAENEDGYLFARAFTSIRFYGHSSPSNWNEYRRRVFEIPEFKTAKARFETVTGPLQQCAYWDV